MNKIVTGSISALIGVFFLLIVLMLPNANIQNMMDSSVRLLCEHPVGESKRTVDVSGSAFFINKTTLVTNEHVSPIGSRCLIITKDEKGEPVTIKTRQLWTSESPDVAILSADLPELMEFPVSAIYESKIISGDEVFSVGYPTTAGTSTNLYDYIKSTGNDSSLDGNYNLLVGFLKPQIFKGVISSEYIVEGVSYIQTDAAINSGISGGPLYSNSGQVIGLTTMRDIDAQNVGYSISVQELIPILKKLEIDFTLESSLMNYVRLFNSFANGFIAYILALMFIASGIYIILSRSAIETSNQSPNNVSEPIQPQPMVQQRQQQGRIIFQNMSVNPPTLNFATKVFLGREQQSSIKFPSDWLFISKLHAMIEFDLSTKTFLVKDLKSRNGTFINNKRMKEGTTERVSSGTSLYLGKENAAFTLEII